MTRTLAARPALSDVLPGPPERRAARRPIALALVVLVVAGAVAGGALVLGGRDPVGEPAAAEARAFLDRYEGADGRVARPDQGGDTVSEGQAYAMLLAVFAGDWRRFDLAWRWAVDHLGRPDGLLSWHWDRDRVVDAMPAADADLDAAWALALAASRFGRPSYQAQAAVVGAAVLRAETIGGLLVAGPWAAIPPVTVNPGYDAPEAFAALGQATGDGRWSALAASYRGAIGQLTSGGARLPPDWATRDATGRLRPAGAPGRAGAAQYGLDASRVVMWLAASCDAADRHLASAIVSHLSASPAAPARRLDGAPAGPGASPASLAPAALGAAVTDRGRARTWMDRARSLAQRHPTYYGDAIVAVANVLYHRPAAFGGCPAGI